jgi:uncharacterized protein (DUF433 family)
MSSKLRFQECADDDLQKLPLKEGNRMATIDWSECPLVEVIPRKVSGAPLLKNTRLPIEAITGNYDAFVPEALSPEAAIAETLECYPETSVEAAHQFQRSFENSF